MKSNSSIQFSMLTEEENSSYAYRDSSRLDRAKKFCSPSNMKHNAWNTFQFVAYPRGSPLWTELKNNWKSGLTVSLVSVPLSLSLAIASGSTPELGLTTAFWGGLSAALLGGSHYNITGPTGALSGLLASAVLEFGIKCLPILAILSGLICFLVWVFKLDKYVMFIPSSVIHGFTIGVAFIIALNQLNSIFGLKGLPKHETFLENTWESLLHLPQTNFYSLIFFAVNLTALFLLSKKWPTFPWAILLSLNGILFGFLSTKGYLGAVQLQTLEGRYDDIHFVFFNFPHFDKALFNFQIFKLSIGVAFIAILETLISARIADGMTKTEHQQSREVFSIGVSNIISGLAGGIPATAALARTSLNIRSGATSRISAVINCFSVLIISFLALPFFKYIPMSIVGALLVMVAIRMVSTEHLIHMFRFDRTMFWISVLSAIFCVAMDTMAGILVGGVLSLLVFTDKISVGHSEIQLNRGKRVLSHVDLGLLDVKMKKDHSQNINIKELEEGAPLSSLTHVKDEEEMSVLQSEEFEDTLVYRFSGQLTYINAIPHLQRVRGLAHETHIKNVILSLRYVWYVDLDAIDSLKEMISILTSNGMKVLLAGLQHGNVKGMLSRHAFIQKEIEEGNVFPTYVEALNSLSPENTTEALNSDEEV